jgi:hypothetical protein
LSKKVGINASSYIVFFTEACTIQHFAAVIVAVSLKARAFASAFCFHPNLILEYKSRNLPLAWSLIRGSALVDYSLAYKFRLRKAPGLQSVRLVFSAFIRLECGATIVYGTAG